MRMPLPYLSVENRIDTNALVLGVRASLLSLKEQINFIRSSQLLFFQSLQSFIAKTEDDAEKTELTKIYSQITHAGEFIDIWMQTAVKDMPTFEFFVMAKATEIKSGDSKQDYFWALAIRYDQLIALLRVLELFIDQLKRWPTLSVEALVNDPVFLGLGEYSLEDQMYLEAEQVHQTREKKA